MPTPPAVRLAQTGPSAAPTLDQIIDRAEQASGGKQAWSAITSMHEGGRAEASPSKMVGTFDLYLTAPNKIAQTINFGRAGTMRAGYDGATGWKLVPGTGYVDLVGDELENLKLNYDFYGAVDLKRLYPQMTLQDDATFDGRGAYAVLATPTNAKPRKLYFDKESGVLLGMAWDVAADNETTHVETYYEDYTQVGAIRIPYTIRQVSPKLTLVLTVHDAQPNAIILNSGFSKPGVRPEAAAASGGDTTVVALKHEQGGSVSGNTFTSPSFGFRYKFPAGWNVQSEEVANAVWKVGSQIIAGNNDAAKAAFNESAKRTTELLIVSEYPYGARVKFNPSVQVTSENVEIAPGIENGRDYLVNAAAELRRSGVPVEIGEKISPVTIGGKPFYRLNAAMALPLGKIHTATFSTKIGKSVLSFVFTSNSLVELETLTKTLSTVEFESAAK